MRKYLPGEDLMSEKVKKSASKYAYIEGWLSIFINTGLFALKYWAGVVTGSVAIIADAWHTLSDSISSMVVIAGAKISSKPADRGHPFGHGRAELISSIVIGVLLMVVAGNFFVESIQKIKKHESVTYGLPAVIATVVSILVKEILAQYAFYAGRKTGMQSLTADGWHHRSDAISSVIILAGIALGSFFWWIDAVLGIIVASIIFYAAYTVIRDTSSKIFGEDPPDELINNINNIVAEHYPGDSFTHHYHLHDYGLHRELTFHMRFPGKKSIHDVHTVIHSIEREILNRYDIEATIHPEPMMEKNDDKN